MMEAMEQAQQITLKMNDGFAVTDSHRYATLIVDIEDMIEAAITEAQREARAEMKERAAKVAESLAGHELLPGRKLANPWSNGFHQAADDIARYIRALED